MSAPTTAPTTASTTAPAQQSLRDQLEPIIENMVTNIGLDDSQKGDIMTEITDILDGNKHKLNDIDISALLSADAELQQMRNNILREYGDADGTTKEEFNKLFLQLVKLQSISLLKKIEKDCSEPIRVILETITKKLEAVNNLRMQDLKSDLPLQISQGQAGGAYNKYLKYKNKYINLKKSMKL